MTQFIEFIDQSILSKLEEKEDPFNENLLFYLKAKTLVLPERKENLKENGILINLVEEGEKEEVYQVKKLNNLSSSSLSFVDLHQLSKWSNFSSNNRKEIDSKLNKLQSLRIIEVNNISKSSTKDNKVTPLEKILVDKLAHIALDLFCELELNNRDLKQLLSKLLETIYSSYLKNRKNFLITIPIKLLVSNSYGTIRLFHHVFSFQITRKYGYFSTYFQKEKKEYIISNYETSNFTCTLKVLKQKLFITPLDLYKEIEYFVNLEEGEEDITFLLYNLRNKIEEYKT